MPYGDNIDSGNGLFPTVTWTKVDLSSVSSCEETYQKNKIENCIFKIKYRSTRDQWVKVGCDDKKTWYHTSLIVPIDPPGQCILRENIYGLVQDCSNSSALALELLQSSTKPWIWCVGMCNTLRLRQVGCHFTDDILKCIFFNENIWISLKISLKFVPTVPINNILALVQIKAWYRPGNKPLSKPMMVSLLMHICITWPQWVNKIGWNKLFYQLGDKTICNESDNDALTFIHNNYLFYNKRSCICMFL